MSLAFLFHYLMLNIFRMLIHPSSGACDLFGELFHGLYCSGSRCVVVMVWCGIQIQAEALPHTTWTDQQCFSLHLDTTPPQPNHNVTPTRIEPGMCKFIYMTSEYIQETSSKTYHTQRKLNNHKTPQQPIFAETHFLKQPRTSQLNIHH